MATEDDPDSERASNVLGFWRWMKAAKVLPRGAMPQFYLSFSWLQRNARQAQSLSTMHAAEGTWTLPSQGEFSLLDLDADNIKTVEETTKRIQENLHSSRDSGLLNTMMEYYLKTRSPTCLQILSGIHEARAQVNWSATIEFCSERLRSLSAGISVSTMCSSCMLFSLQRHYLRKWTNAWNMRRPVWTPYRY